MQTSPPPTRVAHRIIAASMLTAFIMYLDRICMGEIVKSLSFKSDLNLSKEEIGWVLGGFFFTYALFQVPAGWASDRFGARPMLTLYILLWSLCTGLTGLATGFYSLLTFRLLCGVAESGAYPTMMVLVRKWFPAEKRARAAGLVALGGRVGGTLAPFLTIWMILTLQSWRASLWVDCLLGFIIAWVFWTVVRSNPNEHPAVNAAELAVIGSPKAAPSLSASELFTAIRNCTRSLSVWSCSLAQLLQNFGWGFLITWLPTYLVEEMGVAQLEGGRMVTCILAVGMFGQIAGGLLSDFASRRFGLRWGRVLPLCASMLTCEGAYALCPFVQNKWILITLFAVVSFCTDLCTPSVWAFTGDVGGRATGAVGGWGNMWGNFGGCAVALLVPWIKKIGGTDGKFPVFFTLSGAFLLAAFIVLPMNATRKILPEEPSTP